MTMKLREEIVRFYENDDDSRMCSGKKRSVYATKKEKHHK